MKTVRSLFFTFLLFISQALSAQHSTPDGGGEMPLPTDDITELKRANILKSIEHTVDSLQALGELTSNKSNTVRFIWPIKLADHVFDYNGDAISNFVDHKSNYPDQLLDYNCRERTYDTENGYNHKGTDIYTWPYSWLKMQNEDVEIIAGAAGTIVGRYDGNYDKNCSFIDPNWNAVYIRHSDGTTALYGHMKNGTLTEKVIGQTVEQGEYLGIVGSSGNSTGPHLHFELLDVDGLVIDPFIGACNAISESYWEDQPAYYDSQINAVRTHYTAPEFYFNSCSTTESPNYRDGFLIGDNVILATYYKDQRINQLSSYSMVDANQMVIDSWQHSSSEEHYNASYWYWERQILEGAPKGVWEFRVNYEGQEYGHRFTVSDPATKPLSVPLFFPYDNEVLEDIDPTLRWLPLADAESYEIQIATDNVFSNIVKEFDSVTDNEVLSEITENGSYYWRVRATNNNGIGDWSEIWKINIGQPISTENDEFEIPTGIHLLQNYPNPFNPSTSITFILDEPLSVSVAVYDLLGREIEVLTNSYYQVGEHSLNFNAESLTSGVYLYQIQTDKFTEVRRMTLIK